MAVIATYKFGDVIGEVLDDAIRGVPEEELQRRREEFSRYAIALHLKYGMKNQSAEEKTAQ